MLKQANLIISRITLCVINKNNMKKFWSGITWIINIGKVKADYIPSILESGKTVDNPCAIANIFNNFFVNVGKNTDKDIPDSMFLSPVTSVEVDSYISQMDNNKSIGPYSIPVPLLKILKIHISPLISSLINDCFLCGIFPSKLKLAKVTPVFKKGSRQDKDNYRPISVLSIFSKIFEKAMFKRLYGYLESCNILYPLQFGSRQKCSTNDTDTNYWINP